MVYKGARPEAKWKPGPTTYGGNEMKKLVLFGLTTLIMVVASVGVAQAQSKEKKNVIYVAAEKATFSQSPTAGVSMAVLWGDPNKGPHGTFTKFAPGYDAGTGRVPPSPGWPQTLERWRQSRRRVVLSGRVWEVRPHTSEVEEVTPDRAGQGIELAFAG